MDTKNIDKDNEKNDYYYDAMEYLNDGDIKTAKKLLKEAIKIDDDYVAAYVGMAAVFKEENNEKKIREYANLAFEKTRKAFPEWPEEMMWGVTENRQYLRAICNMAFVYHKDGDFQKAEELYRLLLKFNPSDNQGIRYYLAAMYIGKAPEYVDDLFDEGNERQNWDKLADLLYEQNKLHHFFESPDDI